jgi:hypothetical protein
MLDLEVIEDPSAAAIAVEPIKSKLLAALVEPASAATLAARLRIPRQKSTITFARSRITGSCTCRKSGCGAD